LESFHSYGMYSDAINSNARNSDVIRYKQ
jgi:hypothetical protein